MIDKTPTGWTKYLEDGYSGRVQTTTDVYDTTCFRVSALLGPDGEPLRVSIPRQKIGFHVAPKGEPK